MNKNKYVMTISRKTVDKLGIKLYDRVSAVIAELVANSYDADAKKVTIEAPMGEMLSQMEKGKLKDKGLVIKVMDNGVGMTPDQVNKFYLRVGAERRSDPERGDVSRKYGRKVMGRKGVGKLAPFGICQIIEIISSGGDKIKQGNKHGYLIAHLILDGNEINKEEEFDYSPEIGVLDGTLNQDTGTTIIMRQFYRRRVPEIQEFCRQLAQRFGLSQENWEIVLKNSLPNPANDLIETSVGSFDIETMENTKIEFKKQKINGQYDYVAAGPGKVTLPDIKAGFEFEGEFYPVEGWVAYSKHPYRDDLMAGVRIYCRGKIAAQTNVFNRKAGFTGEHSVRSYLVGELHADWLDEKDDLIQTDRRDILWSDERGQSFEEWGQKIVQKLGTLSRDPMKKKVWDQFQEVADLDLRLDKAFPGDAQKEVKEKAFQLTKMIGQRVREDEVQDKGHVDGLVSICILMAPHIKLEEKLREAADKTTSPLAAVSEILKAAKIAELSSFGMIASDRVKVIEHIEELINTETKDERVFQDVIERAPWLINPQWSPITMNQSLATFKKCFERFYKKETGIEISLADFELNNKRPDFIMTSFDSQLEIIEIKAPGHSLNTEDYIRLRNYIDLLDKFLSDPGNKEFKDSFPEYHVTLVCDKVSLSDVMQKDSYSNFKNKGKIQQISWATFLKRTRNMHQDFLNEAEKQKKNAEKEN